MMTAVAVRLLPLSFLALLLMSACTKGADEAAGTAIAVQSLVFDLPAGWQQEPPASTMRAVQAVIPGEPEPGQFAVFHFGEGKGGGAEENIRRWISQMEFAPGSADARQQFDAHGLLVTWVDFAGKLKASPMTGGPSQDQPDARLLGAVVEGPGGPWFFKATGPNQTLAAQRDAFLKMLESVRPK